MTGLLSDTGGADAAAQLPDQEEILDDIMKAIRNAHAAPRCDGRTVVFFAGRNWHWAGRSDAMRRIGELWPETAPSVRRAAARMLEEQKVAACVRGKPTGGWANSWRDGELGGWGQH